MILSFPNIDVLRLALTSGIIAQDDQCEPVRFARSPDESILVDAPRLSQPTLAELKKLGVEKKRSVNTSLRSLISWHQALPVTKTAAVEGVGQNTEVLLEIEGHEQLPLIVSEMMRLGNDRQSFRYLDENGEAKTLLRVTAPPFYTLLRALDQATTDVPIVAYVQQCPRVWVQLGCRHPLGDRLRPPAGKWLLISSDDRWRYLTEGAFRDVYDVLEFKLPHAERSFAEREPSERIKIPLELAPGSPQDGAELWVLKKNAMEQVEKLIRRSDDLLISRLAFAVANRAEAAEPMVILRARPSKQLPPILVLDGVAFRSYLKIPNLFLPVAHRLHPPLRRDAVVKLLADQSDQITWLIPTEAKSFVPESIADKAFRPMSDWVDYVIDHQSEPLQAWVASHRFDFEHFVCSEDANHNKPSRPTEPVRRGPEQSELEQQPPDIKVTKRILRKQSSADEELTFVDSEQEPQEKLQLRLRELEEDYLQSDQPIDSPLRTALWKEMAIANAELNHRSDSTICWLNALWAQPIDEVDCLDQWLRCEQHCSSVGTLTEESLDTLTSERTERSKERSLLAAYLAWAGECDETPPLVDQRRSELAQYLQRQERYLPVRAVWLAWRAMYKMSGNDVLMLARARDRLLQRLFDHGLTPDADMASFMRGGSTSGGDRFRVLRNQLLHLRSLVIKWISEPSVGSDPQTKSYADLIFTFALARLGETGRCDKMLEDISKRLSGRDLIHDWVYEAFSLRIQQALDGKANQEQLSEELLQPLETMHRTDRYILDRIRERSRILEPHIRIDPYRNWHKAYADVLSRELALLQNIVDGEELDLRITKLMKKNKKQLVRVLPVALQLSPRIGEHFAFSMLEQVPAALKECPEAMDKALLLHRAMHLAANYGRVDLVHEFLNSLNAALPAICNDYLDLNSKTPESLEKTAAVEGMLSQSFHGLRKLGMQQAIGTMYGTVANLVASRNKKAAKSKQSTDHNYRSPRSHRLLLCVAGGWYFFGQEQNARTIVDQVRVLLKSGELKASDQRGLTCAYLNAVSQAPIDENVARVSEIFTVDKKSGYAFPQIRDSMTTSSHFSISQLDVVEAAVLPMISDDFSLSGEARRWLDEDEFLVRSRIHREMREASGG